MEVVFKDSRIRLDPVLLRHVEEAVWRGEGRRLRISLCVVGAEESRRINREFLNRDWETDVIAFDLHGGGEGVSDDLDGEIVVNAELARREAARRGHGAEAELLFYVAHGLLHLLGYDDTSPDERARMLERQARYLEEAGVEIRS